jgi:hypothetical protein
MKQQHKTWVCTICSQTFTRNSSSKRHNTNLHEGKGDCVRYIDYEIGRGQGKYFQNNPIFYKKKSATNHYIAGKRDGDYRLFSPNFIHNRDFGGDNDFLKPVINAKYEKSSRKDSFIDNVVEIMDVVDRIHKIANKILNEDEIKQFTKGVLTPYFTNHPEAKKMVEEQLEKFKKHIALKRYQTYFNS